MCKNQKSRPPLQKLSGRNLGYASFTTPQRPWAVTSRLTQLLESSSGGKQPRNCFLFIPQFVVEMRIHLSRCTESLGVLLIICAIVFVNNCDCAIEDDVVLEKKDLSELYSKFSSGCIEHQHESTSNLLSRFYFI